MATNILLAVVGLVVFSLALRRLVEWIGSPCQFCEEKTRLLRRLDAETQTAILGYFIHYERREPDRSGLFVCLHCKTVHDDYSGERASWDVDAHGCVTFCKVCHDIVRGCEPDRESIECPGCGTKYSWKVHEGSGFRFLMPPKDATILRRGLSTVIDSR
jgi:hypothetical protein